MKDGGLWYRTGAAWVIMRRTLEEKDIFSGRDHGKSIYKREQEYIPAAERRAEVVEGQGKPGAWNDSAGTDRANRKRKVQRTSG